MTVVSDTTPLISLLKIGKLDILKEIFGDIYIPKAVLSELTINDRYTDEATEILNCGFIHTGENSDENDVSVFSKSTGLDIGEVEAILLAQKMSADYLLIDEAKGRDVAEKIGLTIVGTIGILIQAFNKKMLTSQEIELGLKQLKEAGRFISDDIYSYIRKIISGT